MSRFKSFPEFMLYAPSASSTPQFYPQGLARRGLALGLAALLLGCQAAPPIVTPHAVGADRDPQGCIPSAGYAWCPATRRCERPWELAAAAGFELTAENVARHCEAR